MGFIKYKDEAGNWQEVLVIKGEPGPMGPAPIRGVHFWTEGDKKEIHAYIDGQLHEAEALIDEMHAEADALIGGDAS